MVSVLILGTDTSVSHILRTQASARGFSFKKMIKGRDKMPPLKYNWDDTVERFFKKKNLYQ